MLDKDVLGANLYNAEQQFNDKAPADLGDLTTARQQFWTGVAEQIINHFKNAGMVHTTGTASAQTGTIS